MTSFTGPVALATLAAFAGSLCSAAEVAVTSLPEARLQSLIRDGDRDLARYDSDRMRTLSRWLVARVLAIAVTAALLAEATESVIGNKDFVIAVFGSVVCYSVFAEVLGTIARRRPEQVARLGLRFLRPVEYLVFVLAEPLALLGRMVGLLVPEQEAINARTTQSEVEWAVRQGEEAGALAEEPAEMIRNVLDFKDLTVREVMVPRTRISVVDVTTPLDQVLEMVALDGHSRYPVFRETLDNIVGLLYVKDLFDLVRRGALKSTLLRDIVRKPVLFVIESQSALSVLRDMRSRRQHMAIVADHFGGTSGVVTLEDIIEEIVGEIHDEYDAESDTPVQKLSEGRFSADAAINLADLEAHTGLVLPSDEGDFESLGGFLVHRAGRVPDVGSVIVVGDYRLVVKEADDTKVMRVEILRRGNDSFTSEAM